MRPQRLAFGASGKWIWPLARASVSTVVLCRALSAMRFVPYAASGVAVRSDFRRNPFGLRAARSPARGRGTSLYADPSLRQLAQVRMGSGHPSQIAAGEELLLVPESFVHVLAVPAVPLPVVKSWQSCTALFCT